MTPAAAAVSTACLSGRGRGRGPAWALAESGLEVAVATVVAGHQGSQDQGRDGGVAAGDGGDEGDGLTG